MIKIDERYCPKDHRCPARDICPVGAIVQTAPFSAPEIIQEKCIKCGKCIQVCPTFKWENE